MLNNDFTGGPHTRQQMTMLIMHFNVDHVIEFHINKPFIIRVLSMYLQTHGFGYFDGSGR